MVDTKLCKQHGPITLLKFIPDGWLCKHTHTHVMADTFWRSSGWPKSRCPTWNPGNWKQRLKPAAPWCFNFHPCPPWIHGLGFVDHCPLSADKARMLDTPLARLTWRSSCISFGPHGIRFSSWLSFETTNNVATQKNTH